MLLFKIKLHLQEFPTLLFYAAEDGAKPIKIDAGDLKVSKPQLLTDVFFLHIKILKPSS